MLSSVSHTTGIPLTLEGPLVPVPTMALGVPGDAITAVIPTTLILYGIAQGPRVVEHDPTPIAAILAGHRVVDLLRRLLGMLLSRGAAHIRRLREAFMMTAIVIVAAAVAILARGYAFDLPIVAGAGTVGFLLRPRGFPMAPVVVGMVPGPTPGSTSRQALILPDGDVLVTITGHPIALSPTLIVALTLPVRRGPCARGAA